MPHGALPLLGDSAYLTYVGPLAHRGANPTAHLAEMRYPGQNAPVVSVVKLLHPGGLCACNEAMAWLFLRAADIAAPRHAAMVRLTEAKAVKALGKKLVRPELVQDGYVLAWAAKKLEFQSIKALFAGREGDGRWLAALNTAQGLAIAAFDETFLNIDRNPGNVLYMGKDAFVPIDHELCFGMQDWMLGELRHSRADGDSLARLKRARGDGTIAQPAYETALNRMAYYAETHAPALAACRVQIARLLHQIYPTNCDTMTERVLSFLTERTAQQWIKDRLGVI